MLLDKGTIRYKYILIDTIIIFLLFYILDERLLYPILIIFLSYLISHCKFSYILFDLIECRSNIIINSEYSEKIQKVKKNLDKIIGKDINLSNLNINILGNKQGLIYTSSIFNIYISENLFKDLDIKYLLAAILHEIGHIKSRDLHINAYILNRNILLALVLISLYKMGFRKIIILVFILYAYIYLSYIFLDRDSLNREILADAYVVVCGYGKELVDLLERYKLFYNKKFNCEYIIPSREYIYLNKRIEILKK